MNITTKSASTLFILIILITLLSICIAQNLPSNKYTQKDLQADMQLSIEELRVKYPIDWFFTKFGSVSACDIDDSGKNGNICYIREYVKEFKEKEIISIFAINGSKQDMRMTQAISEVYCNIENFKIIKNLLYRKDILQNINWFTDEIYKCIPKDLPYYKEVLFEHIDHPSEIARNRRLNYFSPTIQQEYKQSRKEKYNY